MINIEDFSDLCPHCNTEEERRCCPHCKGTGEIHIYYRRFCNYHSRYDCEWGGDCKYCPDSEQIDVDEISY